jgi:hypothetical protein
MATLQHVIEEVRSLRAALVELAFVVHSASDPEGAAAAVRVASLPEAGGSADVPPVVQFTATAVAETTPATEVVPIELDASEDEPSVGAAVGAPVQHSSRVAAGSPQPGAPGSRRSHWKPEETAELISLRLRKVTFREIGDRLGKSLRQCKEKYKYERERGRA